MNAVCAAQTAGAALGVGGFYAGWGRYVEKTAKSVRNERRSYGLNAGERSHTNTVVLHDRKVSRPVCP
jgi:hypothetical protein